MYRRRSNEERRENLFSPPVDVLANTVLVMFLYAVFFLVTIGRDPAIPKLIDAAVPPCIAGLPYEFSIPSEGGVGPRKLVLIQGNLPKGLSLDSNSGSISGIVPLSEAEKNHVFTVALRDPTGKDQKEFTIAVSRSVVPLRSDDFKLELLNQETILPVGRVGKPYEAIIGHAGGVGPIEWREVGKHTLPDIGLKIDHGCITGTPDKSGKYVITIKASFPKGITRFRNKSFEWNGYFVQKKYTLNIISQLNPSSTWLPARTGQKMHLALGAFLLPDEVISYNGLPEGLRETEDGSLSGSVAKPGRYEISYVISCGKTELARGVNTLNILPKRPDKISENTLCVGHIGDAVRKAISYRGLVEPVRVKTKSALPSSIALTGNILTFTPTNEGYHHVGATLQDAVGNEIQTDLEFLGMPQKKYLRFDMPSEIYFVLGQKVHLRLTTTGGIGTARISIKGAVPGLSLAEGVLTGIPETTGSWKVHMTAEDLISQELAEHTMLARVVYTEMNELTILTRSLPPAVVGRPYTVALSASGIMGKGDWSVLGQLPTGITCSGGCITGIPTKAQELTFGIEITDSMKRSDRIEKIQLLVMHAKDITPQITSTSLPTAIIGIPYKVALSAQGGLGVYQWQVIGDLPPGLALQSGLIQGTPTHNAVGNWQIQVVAEDMMSIESRPQQLEVQVKDLIPYNTLSILTKKLPIAVVNQPYDVCLATHGGSGKIIWNIEGRLPEGLSFRNGEISGIPRLTGESRFSLAANDHRGRSTQRHPYTIKVITQNAPVPAKENETSASETISRYTLNRWGVVLIACIAFAIGYLGSYMAGKNKKQ
jgi:hypothetical protein